MSRCPNEDDLNHSHAGIGVEKKLGIVFVITLGIFVVEMIGGILSNSISLLSDSFHILTDFLSIGLTFIAFRVARRPRSPTMSFGFPRIEIFAALANGITMIAITTWIFYEAYSRFLHPGNIDIPIVLGFATIGLVANILMALLLKKESKTNLNIKGSYAHILGDLVSTIAVISGAVLMIFIPNTIVDVIISVGVGALILRFGISISKECYHILMEGTPHEIKLDEVAKELQKFEEITDVHGLHIWTLTSNIVVMSVHVKIKQQYINHVNSILKKIKTLMKENFGIDHSTIQVENEDDLINPDN
jgi:cobalt-zinc-cadmium efflux system protein